MNANVAATEDDGFSGAVRPADSLPTRATAEFLSNNQLSSRTSCEGPEQHKSLRRLPSPGNLWSDSEEVNDPVSDQDLTEQNYRSSRRVSARISGSVCESEMEDHVYRSANSCSSDLTQSPTASQVGQTDPDMDRVARFVGYSESEFEKESDEELQPLRSKFYRNGKLPPSKASKTASDVRSTHNKSTARIGHPTAHAHSKQPAALNSSKGKANARKSKPAPFEQSSSSEDEEPSSGEDIEYGDTLHKPPSPPQQPPSQALQQASPPASRQTPVHTPSSAVQPQASPQEAATRTLSAGWRGRLQQVLAKKGLSSRPPPNQGYSIAKNGVANSGNPASETRQVVEDTSKPLTDRARPSNATTQANRLQKTFTSTPTQSGLQKQKPQHVPRTETQASQQRQSGRQKPVPTPTSTTLDVSKADDQFEVAWQKITKPSHLDVVTPVGRKLSGGIGQHSSTPASRPSSRKSSSSAAASPSALPYQQSPSLVISRPAMPARVTEASLKTPPKSLTAASTMQTDPTNPQGTTKSKPPRIKAPSTISNGSRSVGGPQSVQQHQKGVPGDANVPKSMQSKPSVTNAKAFHLNKPAQQAGASGKPASTSSIAPKLPAKKPPVSVLHSILTEVSTGNSAVEKVNEYRAQVGERLPVVNNITRKDARNVPISGSNPICLNNGPDEAISSSKAKPSGAASNSAPMTSANPASNIDSTATQLRTGTSDGLSYSPGLARPSTNANAEFQRKKPDSKSLSVIGHSRQGGPPHNPVETPLQTAARTDNAPVSAQSQPFSTISPSAPLPTVSGTFSSLQPEVTTASLARSPPTAQPQAPDSPQTGAGASIPSSIRALESLKTPSLDASKPLSSAQIKPAASVEKSVSRSSDSNATVTRRPTKTHTRVPSGPTEDGFDIYIPPAPGTGKATPMPIANNNGIATPTAKNNATATPATQDEPGRDFSKADKKVPGAKDLSSVREVRQRQSSAPMVASKSSTGVATTVSVRRPNLCTNQSALALGAAPASILRHGNGVSAPVAGSKITEGTKTVINTLFAKRPGNTASALGPKGPLSTTHKTIPNEVKHASHLTKTCGSVLTSQPNPQSLAVVTPRHTTERAEAVVELPEIVLQDRPRTGPAPEPYFEYRIKQKIWPQSGTEIDANALTVGFSSTVVEAANRQAEELFTQTKDQYLCSFPIQHQRSFSAHDENGCLALTGTMATIGWPVKQIHLRIWVERGEVPSDAVTFNPAPKFTPFLSKTLYILRLYKLADAPTVDSNEEDQDESEIGEDADGDDEASGSEPGDDASSSDPDDNSTESDSDVDKGKHNKKRQAKQALGGSPPAKRRKTKPASPKPTFSKRIIRQHHPIPRPEVYTTLYTANSAACDVQIDIMNEHTFLGQSARASNAAGLRRKLTELAAKEGEERYWHNVFAVGLVGAKMEIQVEAVGVCGPRNV